MKFKGHESFPLRKGWIFKGLKGIKNNIVNESLELIPDEKELSDLFLRSNATDILGVGANMVKSIRYYLKALGLTQEQRIKNKLYAYLTPYGSFIEEYDPYLRNMESIVLLHWLIASNIEYATSFYVLFNNLAISEFNKDDFTLAVNNFTALHDYERQKSSVIDDDFNCLVNCYCSRGDEEDPENNFASPLSKLGLLTRLRNGYYAKASFKITDVNSIFWLALINLMHKNEKEIQIEQVLSKNGSLGKTFNLSRLQVMKIIEELHNANLIKLIRTSSLDVFKNVDESVFFSETEGLRLLQQCYKNVKHGEFKRES